MSFTFVFPSVSVINIKTRYELFRKIFWTKKHYFLNWAFLLMNLQNFISLLKILLQIHFGSGAAGIRSRIQKHWRSPCFWSCLVPLNSRSRNASGPVYKRILRKFERARAYPAPLSIERTFQEMDIKWTGSCGKIQIFEKIDSFRS